MSDMKKAVDTLAQGLGVGIYGDAPKFLEAIAMALGHTHPGEETLADSASRIANALERIADHLEGAE